MIYDDILWNMFVAYLRLWGVDLYTFLCCEACALLEKMPFLKSSSGKGLEQIGMLQPLSCSCHS